MPNLTVTFPARLAQLRRAAGLSQRQLATAAGLQSSTVSRMERGERRPTLSTLLALAGALKCGLDALASRG